MLVFISIYNVFRGSVDHGGGVSIYLYIYIHLVPQVMENPNIASNPCTYMYIFVHTDARQKSVSILKASASLADTKPEAATWNAAGSWD